MEHLKAPWKGGGQFLQQGQEAGVTLDGCDPRAGLKKRLGESARARTDLDDMVRGARFRQTGDLPGDVQVEKKMLAQTLVRLEAMGGEAIRNPDGKGQCDRRRAISPAMRRAAMKLSARARPLPAMSKAVPWSGEVRTTGRPRVRFTPPQKSSILIGMRA